MFDRLSLNALRKGLGRVQALRERIEDAEEGLRLRINEARASRTAAIAAIGEELAAIENLSNSI